MAGNKLLVYLLRRDLRAIDNPILHHLATTDHGFTHLLPIYILPPHQIETSGFVVEGQKSPYPLAKSQVARFWRCGTHRAKFQAECIWDVKQNFENIGSGILVRIGKFDDVLKHLIKSLNENNQSVDTVWMTEEPSKEELDDQNAVASVCSKEGINFKLWQDEKYFIDDRDTGLSKDCTDLSDVFTSYRKTQEPLRERPRPPLPRPQAGSLPPFPSWIPSQQAPFRIPDDYDEFQRLLLEPIKAPIISDPPPFPEGAKSAHPFKGGENPAWDRLYHLIKSGAMTTYQETRNGLLGTDYSTKLSAYLAMGTITARSIHDELVKFEDGTEKSYSTGIGFGEGESEGGRSVRFELLWRDYMRLCTMKFGTRLFKIDGFKGASGNYEKKWLYRDDPGVDETIDRLIRGTSGIGLIDASMRELYFFGYTSNRARQNVASFMSKHLSLDWRIGASLYECLLIDYDTHSNWGNWQYASGCGNDPRSSRIFNPIKQAFDYDINGDFCRTYVPELRSITALEHVFQVSTTPPEELEKYGLTDNIMVTNPLKRIEFSVTKPRGNRRPYRWRKQGDRGRGGRGGRGGGNTSGNGSFNGNRHNEPSSLNGDGSYMQNQPRDWASGGNQQMGWRGNSHGLPSGRGYMQSFRGNSDGYNHSRQYMAEPAYAPQHYYSQQHQPQQQHQYQHQQFRQLPHHM
jgi:deoxyribodipyrimidine photo-lyase